MNILSPILKGDIGERYITKHLKRNGYKILCKNMRNSCSEIDIIACKDDVIAFVEVKTRTAGQKIPAVYAVDNKKQKKIMSAAFKYLADNKIEKQPRFDVAEVYLDKSTHKVESINYIENAFYQGGSYGVF